MAVIRLDDQTRPLRVDDITRPIRVDDGVGLSYGTMGKPAWVENYDLFADFKQNLYYSTGAQQTSSIITDTHNDANMMIQNTAGVWGPVAANTLARNDAGLHTAPTRTNKFLYSNNQMNVAGWIIGSGGAVKVVGPKASPLGGFATRVTGLDTSTLNVLTQPSGGRPTITQNEVVAVSWILAYVDQVWLRLSYTDNTVGAMELWFNVQTGTIGTVGGANGGWSASTATVTALADGYWQVTLVATRTGATTATCTCNAIPVAANGSSTRVVGTSYDVAYIGLEIGAFVSPPIITAGAPVTRLGNQQVISGLGASLAAGIAGFIKVDVKGVPTVAEFDRLLELNDNTNNNRLMLYHSGGNLMLRVDNAGVTQANISLGAYQLGLQTIAYSVGNNFALGRRVGGSTPSAVTLVSYPSMNRAVIGGRGTDTAAIMYGITQKLALKFGAQNQASFDAMYAAALTA